MTKEIDYEKTEVRLRMMGLDPFQEHSDWCRDGADAIATLMSEVKRLKEEDARLRKAWARDNNEIQQVLGRALGYSRYCDDQKSFPGATDADGVCVGDHVAASLVDEAAKRIVTLMGQLAEKDDDAVSLPRDDAPAPKVVEAEYGETYVRPEFLIEPDEGDL